MKKLIILIYASMFVVGCTHDTHFMKMEESLSIYGSAIRWGYFQKAADFQAKPKPLDLEHLKEIHVTSYDPVHRREFADGERAEQTVEIRYFRESVGVEKKITDTQTWRYDKEKDRWFLDSDLPYFQ